MCCTAGPLPIPNIILSADIVKDSEMIVLTGRRWDRIETKEYVGPGIS
jgi:hypothetical protein